ncbi:MAG: outer membrane beta-barrel protein [Parvibaculaceae bacterium]
MGRNHIAALLALLLIGGFRPALAQEADMLRGTQDPLAPLEEADPTLRGTEDIDTQQGLAIPAPPPPPQLTVGPAPEESEPPLRRKGAEEEPFAPLGVRTGGLILYPALELGGVVTDNVRQTKRDRKSDIGLRVAPALRVESDWVRHALRLSANGDFTFYETYDDFNRTNLDAEAGLRLDVRRSTTLDLTANYSLTQTSSSDIEVPNNAVGQRQDEEAGVLAALKHRFNRLEATLTTGASWLFYGDVDLAGGGTEDNSDRDYVEPSAGLRLGYEASPAFTPFIEAVYAPRIHHKEVDRSGLRRDSDGGYARAGTAFNVSEIWSGEAALRVDVRDYEDPTLDTEALVGFDANVSWRPTRLTTVTLTGKTGLEESSLPGVSAVRSYEAGLDVTHALRENIILSAGTGFAFADYPGKSDDEWQADANLALSYILRRNIEFVLGYEFTHLESKAPDDGYTENRVTAGMRFRL